MTQPASHPSDNLPAQPRGAAQARSAGQITSPLGSVLATYGEAWNFAVSVAQAQTLPTALRGNVPDIFMNITYGAELGLSPMQSFRAINVVEGSPSLSGDYLIARIRQFGHTFEIVESDGQKCTTRITRGDNGQAQEWTYTLDDAVAAGLCTIENGKARARSYKGKALPWETATRKMLLWRSTSNNADSICPEVAFGMIVDDPANAEVDLSQPPTGDLAAAVAERERAEKPPEQPETREPEVTDAEFVDQLTEERPAGGPPSAEQLADLEREHAPGPDLDRPADAGEPAAPGPDDPEPDRDPADQCPGCGAWPEEEHSGECPENGGPVAAGDPTGSTPESPATLWPEPKRAPQSDPDPAAKAPTARQVRGRGKRS